MSEKQLPAVRVLPVAIKPEFSEDDKRVIKQMCAPTATDSEFKYFLYNCLERGLNPFMNQIYFIKRKTRQADGSYRELGTIQVSIEGYRSLAERTGKLQGIERGLIEENGIITGAWAKVYRSDWVIPCEEKVKLKDYMGSTPLWQKMPGVMLLKCAETAALRRAFPQIFGGTYGMEEMDQADKDLLPTTQTVIMQAPSAPSREIVKNCKDSEEISRKQACKAIVIEIGRYIQQGLVTAHDIHEVSGFSSIKDLYAQEALEELQSTLHKVKGLISEFEGNQKAMVG